MYESVSDFNNDEPGRLLFAAVSYMYMYTCTSACNTIRERGEGGREGVEGEREGGRKGRREGGEGERVEGEGEREEGRKGGREGYNDIHNITAFIKHSIDLKGFSHMLSTISSLCLSPLISAFPLSLSLSPSFPPSLTPSYYRLSCIMLLLVSLILLFLILILIPLWNLMVI